MMRRNNRSKHICGCDAICSTIDAVVASIAGPMTGHSVRVYATKGRDSMMTGILLLLLLYKYKLSGAGRRDFYSRSKMEIFTEN